MNIVAKSEQYIPRFEVIRGYQNERKAVDKMVKLAWLAAYTILWNGTSDLKADKENVYSFIRQFLINAKDLQSGFDEFIQRLLLARQYMHTEDGLMKVKPKQWFNNPFEGFSKTEKMYQRLQETRTERHLWRWGLKAFADAVFDYGEEQTTKSFHYWRSYFQKRNSQSLLNIFLAFANNVH